MPWACSFSAVLAPTPHSRRTGSGCRNASSRSGGTSSSPSGLASWLATLARNLVRAMPTVMGRPDAVADLGAQPGARSDRGARHPAEAGHVEERLVHRERLDEGGGVAEHLEHRVAGLRSRPTSAAARRSRAGTACGPGARPSRCARRRPWPRSWRRARRRRRRSPACRAARVVTLLDRRVERVEVGVQDAWRCPDTNICSHRGSDELARFRRRCW